MAVTRAIGYTRGIKRARCAPQTLADLLAAITPENLHDEWDTGPPVGAEVVMATAEDLLRLQPHLQSLASAIFQLADEEFAGKRWIAVVLDARCFAQGGGLIAKLRVELPGGTLGSVDIPSAENRTLRHLADVRAEGADRWYGLRLRVTAAGECNTSFDYNPQCADDETFFDF